MYIISGFLFIFERQTDKLTLIIREENFKRNPDLGMFVLL